MSEILGIGTDLCAVDRIEKAVEREHFLRRIYTEQEQKYLSSRGKGAPESAAAMFAAKEAVAKALGTGFSEGVMPEQIEVCHGVKGAPFIRLSGCAEECFLRMGGKKILVSLSHEKEYASAFVTIVGGNSNAEDDFT